MSPDDIRARVARIAAIGERDDEVAHSDEDELHRDVLGVIAGGALGGAELAREALKTRDLTFARWCA